MGHSHKLPAFAIVALLSVATLPAQFRVQPVGEHSSEVTLKLALRQLTSTGTFMQTTAHPDDEDNGLLALITFGRGMRSVLVTATRGDGGQNEIGPELFEALSVLRTEELLAAHRFDGAEQYFTRAIDFGYSFSVEESLKLWGHDEILRDFVRHIRTVRPDVIAGFLCGGDGGGQHHQASTQLTREAFKAAADPARFADQLEDGLRPWQAKRLFCTDMSSFMGKPPQAPSMLMTIANGFEPLLGRLYGDLGIEARSMHKCQGTSQLLPLPDQPAVRTYRLEASLVEPRNIAPKDMFDGIDTSLAGLTRFVNGRPPDGLIAGLRRTADAVGAAERAVAAGGQGGAVQPLAKGLTAVRGLRRSLRSVSLGDEPGLEIDLRLAEKERQFERALTLAHGLRLEVVADDGLVTVGQSIKVSVLVANNAGRDLQVDGVDVNGFEGAFPACQRNVSPWGTFKCEAELKVGNVPLTTPYWRARIDAARYDFDPDVPFGVPFRPSPFRATLSLTVGGVPIKVERTVEYRYDNVIAGEKRMELAVVPPLAVNIGPEIAVIPAQAVSESARPALSRVEGPALSIVEGPATRELEVTVRNHGRGAARGRVSLRAPSGWAVAPEHANVAFTREDESATVRFRVTPAADAKPGEHAVIAVVHGSDAKTLSTEGYDVIEYPHIHRRHLVKEARTRLKIIDVTVPPDLQVGYVMGVGDQVPQAIEQLGATVHFIGPDELAAGDLSVYDVIVSGVRAYERRPDLRANNHRLLEYAANGGTVIVQYNKFEFNQAQYGPFPAKVSANRVTDENAPVEALVPDHPVFNTPNRIGPESWRGWVQERGLYFLGDRDPRYIDLVRLADPFEYNAGEKLGALVEARVGKGRWVYVGLGLWRQLPAGTDGAYRILANLLALGRAR